MRIRYLFAAAALGAACLPTLATRALAQQPAKAAAEKPHPLTLGGVTGQVPGEWKEQPAGGQFRMAQYVLPRAKGDTRDAQFIVFHFGAGGGGSVEENLKRWKGMMRQPEGGDVEKAAKVARSERKGLKLTTMDLPGTYQERPFPASQQVTERPGYRMLAAIVETTFEGGDGPYYLRIVGPAKTVEAAKPGWDRLLASLKGPL
ncbi:MAG: hypothetical protein ACK47B_25875 [Armatimonadota bacterium]